MMNEEYVENLKYMAEFHRGYVAGRKALDAERAAVVQRLRALPLADGSAENLSSIAGAVWHGDGGWSRDNCTILRDKIIELLGGARDGSLAEHDVPGAAGCADCGWQQAAHVTYDALGNERCKAVAELRKMRTDSGGFVKALASAIGVEWSAPRVASTLGKIQQRLIYLLGGDAPELATEDGVITLYDGEGEPVVRFAHNKYENSCWIRSEDEASVDSKEDGDGMARGDVVHGNMPCDGVDGRDVHKEDAVGIRITDELREWMAGSDGYELWCPHHHVELRDIADRIDETFDRICYQQEAVLQSTIDDMESECNRLEDKVLFWMRKCEHFARMESRHAKKVKALLDLLRDAAVEYQMKCNELDWSKRRNPMSVLRDVERGDLTATDAADLLRGMWL